MSRCTASDIVLIVVVFFFFQAEDGIRDVAVTGVQTCALPISYGAPGRNKVLAPLQVDTISVFGERDGASFRHDRDFAQGNSLIERARSARGREAEDFKLRSDITSGQFLATRACAAAFEQVGGQKGHVGAEWFFRELLHGLAHLGGNGRAYFGGGAVTKKDQRKEKQGAEESEE